MTLSSASLSTRPRFGARQLQFRPHWGICNDGDGRALSYAGMFIEVGGGLLGICAMQSNTIGLWCGYYDNCLFGQILCFEFPVNHHFFPDIADIFPCYHSRENYRNRPEFRGFECFFQTWTRLFPQFSLFLSGDGFAPTATTTIDPAALFLLFGGIATQPRQGPTHYRGPCQRTVEAALPRDCPLQIGMTREANHEEGSQYRNQQYRHRRAPRPVLCRTMRSYRSHRRWQNRGLNG